MYLYSFNVRFITDFLYNGSVLLSPVIYCCYCSFCPSGSGKVAIMKVLVVTLEVMVLGRVRSSIKSESKMIQKEVKRKTTDEGLLL